MSNRIMYPGMYGQYQLNNHPGDLGGRLSILETGTKAGIVIGAVQAVRGFNKGRRHIIDSLVNKSKKIRVRIPHVR